MDRKKGKVDAMAKQEWLVRRTLTLEGYFVVLADSQEDAKREVVMDGWLGSKQLADGWKMRKIKTRGLSEYEKWRVDLTKLNKSSDWPV